mmetsp:Transcript_24339/g.75135  ORF Transcript_24339/g.75135 Transcript_24339/m.75135 type:complete len:81 (-) Transcript_24339:48-290(-)
MLGNRSRRRSDEEQEEGEDYYMKGTRTRTKEETREACGGVRGCERLFYKTEHGSVSSCWLGMGLAIWIPGFPFGGICPAM